MKKIRVITLILIAILFAGQTSFAQDDILFRKHLITNGWTGLYYGIATSVIFELDGAGAAAVPIITSGASIVSPLIFNPDKVIDYDALVLKGHGKTIGWAHGFALSTLIGGEKAWYGDGNNSNNYKLTVGLGALTSIGMGIVGNSMAKNNDWSEGRVELYRHYGWLMPYTGLSIAASFSDEARVYGASVLLFGAGGYLLADKIGNWNDYTRGEARSLQVLTAMNLGLGWGIFSDIQARKNIDEFDYNRAEILIPAVAALAGSAAGHFYLRNTNLTPRQGLVTGYAAAGGAVIGLGFAILFESEEITPYYLLPYATGLGTYILTVELMRRNNSTALLPVNKSEKFHVELMPQNLFLNNRIQDNGFMMNGTYVGLQPLIAASVRF